MSFQIKPKAKVLFLYTLLRNQVIEHFAGIYTQHTNSQWLYLID